MFGATIGRVEEGCGRRIATAKGPIVPYIGPQPPGAGLPFAENRHGRVVGVDALGRKDMLPDQKDERHQRGGCSADPISQRRDVEINALAGIDSALAVERQVQAVFGEQNMREQARPGASPRNRM